ncbi:MAG: glycosyltransferase family 2 protein [Chloroflexi bacterium]|nr:glycosyltransferase family 2 protein [Chloroflexota bacterium]
MLSISAVLPAYNEEEVIAASVAAMTQSLESLGAEYEVIVVNDGSRDRTAEIVAELGEQNPRVRLVSHVQNQGYGAALWTGFTSATKDLVFLTDGDKQFDVAELREFLPLLEGADMAIGYRRPRADPLIRRLNGWGWNTIVTLLFGYTARDVDCAFKLFRRGILDHVQVHARGATFSAEFLVKARRLGYVIRERRASHYPRPAGQATGAKPAVIFKAFQELLRLRLSLDSDLARTARARQVTRPGV